MQIPLLAFRYSLMHVSEQNSFCMFCVGSTYLSGLFVSRHQVQVCVPCTPLVPPAGDFRSSDAVPVLLSLALPLLLLLTMEFEFPGDPPDNRFNDLLLLLVVLLVGVLGELVIPSLVLVVVSTIFLSFDSLDFGELELTGEFFSLGSELLLLLTLVVTAPLLLLVQLLVMLLVGVVGLVVEEAVSSLFFPSVEDLSEDSTAPDMTLLNRTQHVQFRE